MSIAPGDRLGPFEIRARLGEGAMGHVFRARDTRLGRDVAVKVMVPGLASDPAAVARFETEARAVAALSHPNIVALYDVGRYEDTAYVVTELIEGETLRDRLSAGQVPARKAADYGRQIATALAAAHDRGIVHRDLKPENVFLTPDGRIKVLDFGVAQMTSAVPPSETATVASAPASAAVVGSIGYMAPEQVRGGPVDHRADIFALGCVLYELVTGTRPFAGDTAADTLAAILHADPRALPPAATAGAPHLDRIVRRCLEKSPHERFQSARDLAFALQDDAPDMPDHRLVQGSRMPWLVGAGALVIATIVLMLLAFAGRDDHETTRPALVRFGIPATMTWSDAASISPDGAYIVYTGGVGAPAIGAPQAAPGGRPTTFSPVSGRFWLRRIDSLDAEPLSDTEAAVPSLFWSPDSRTLGYRAGNTLLVRSLPDGPPRIFAELPTAPLAIAWSPKGVLLMALADGLYRMPATGGALQLVSKSEPGREVWRSAPAFLPDGERFLFNVLLNGSGEDALETRVGSLDGRELAVVGRGLIGPTYADGHLLFGAGGRLFAQPFDLHQLTLTGERVQLGESVAQDWRSGRLAARTSETGVLVFRRAPRSDAQFALVDRYGRHVRNIATPDSFTNFSLSPDEQRIIVARRDPLTAHTSLWLIDVARGVTALASQATDTEDADDPTWAPDGQHIAYRRGGRLVIRLAQGGAERTLVAAEAYPDSFSRDGRWLIYGQPNGNVFEQWALDVIAPGARPIPLVSGVTLADEGRLSPDGKWVAYHSNETGTPQVYAMPFPRTGEKWQISQQGGVQPRWAADGRELYYLDPEGRLMAVRTPGNDPRQASAPAALFATGLVPSDALDQYAPTTNGFIVRTPVSAGPDAAAVQVLINWTAALSNRKP
jgi:serine/threonine protein kinase/Tol biopolymer transport system component